MTSRSSLVALRPFFSCPRFFYAYFVSFDLSMDPVQSFQVQTPRAPSCGVRSAQRVLDQYLCVFAIQGVCLRSILFCSLLTFTQQINTHIGQGGVVCSAGDLSRHAGALTARAYLINTSAEKYKQGRAALCCIAGVLFGHSRKPLLIATAALRLLVVFVA